MILSSTSRTETEWIPSTSYYTPFYESFMNAWNWNLSVEENFIALFNDIENDPLIDITPVIIIILSMIKYTWQLRQ